MANRIPSRTYPGVYSRELTKAVFRGKPDKTFWYAIDYEGQRHFVRVGRTSDGVTADEAHTQRLKLLLQIASGERLELPWDRRGGPTFQAAMDAWQAWAEGEGKDVRSKVDSYKKHLAPTYARKRLGRINLGMLERTKVELMGKNLAPATVTMCLWLMGTVFNFAIKRGLWRGLNPASSLGGLSKPRLDNKGERFLTREEARQLLGELEKRSPVWHDMAFVALNTGMRLTELLRLNGRDIDESNLTATVTAKGGLREPVLLTEEVLGVLNRNRREPGEPVFRNKFGRRFKQANTSFAVAVKACGFNEGVTDRRYRVWFHTLRHTFASWLAQRGVCIYDLMRLMRHHKVEMTQRYAHLIPDQQRECLAVIPKMLNRPASR